jgi:two-component system, OmpR family, response regulator CpxR
MPAVLVIDDDHELAELLARSLRQEGFQLQSVHTGEEGLRKIEAERPDLVLLDVTMPGMNGFEALRRIRRQWDVPVIMLTARGEEVDRIVGLEIGADDYLAKPFSVRELSARMHAILRRVKKAQGDCDKREIRLGAVTMDLLTRSVKVNGEPVHLTTGEYDLLHALMESPGAPLSRETLCKNVLGREYTVFDRAVDNLVSGLRRKLGGDAAGRERIKTLRNAGYVFVDLD